MRCASAWLNPLRVSSTKLTSMHKEHATEIPPPKRPVFPGLLTH
jgi:hypothetical protein